MGSASVEDPVELARSAFYRRHGRSPQWIASAPGRVNLIGEHTDYNDGFVLPMAIERCTAVAAAANGTDRIVLQSAATEEIATIDLSQPLTADPKGSWANYPKGVIAGFLAAGHTLPGFDALIHSSVPLGGGLSSSAALEASMATTLEAATGINLGAIPKALLCQQAEHAYAGVPCGIMDPFISIMGRAGHVLLLDCRTRHTAWIPLDDASVSVLIINTNVKHRLNESEYSARRQSCAVARRVLAVPSLRDASMDMLQSCVGRLDDTSWRCARHVITEIARTSRAALCLRDRNWNEFGFLLDASHESLKIDYRVSSVELDEVVNIAHDLGPRDGVFGCRLTGGGFGGCAVALIETDKQERITHTMAKEYLRRTGIAATLFVTRPADGAKIIQS